jgi:hypothetical protein
MESHSQFDLLCNRPITGDPVRFADCDETDEAFSQRQQCRNQTKKDNALLNTKSRDVREELTERRWAMMYLQYLINRIKRTNRVMIQLSDLPSIEGLSLNDPESSSSTSLPLLMYRASIEQHIEVLEQRKRDAQIGMEISWTCLNTLALGLTSGK